jgi:hypothetical protein
MPKLQDWKCESCSHVFEYLSMGEDDQPGCPECGSLKTAPTLSTPLVTKCHDPEVLKETLQKRSADNTAAGVRKLASHRGTLPKRFGRKGSQIGDG